MYIRRTSHADSAVSDFIAEHSDTVFTTPEWYSVIKEGFHSEVRCYALEDDGKILLVLPGIILDFKVVTMFYSNIPYGGFIGDANYVPVFLPLLEKKLLKDGIHMIRITKAHQDNFENPVGYRVYDGCQHVLSLEGLTKERLWAGYKQRVRRDIRRAEKLGIQIREIGERDEIEKVFDLYSETMERNNTYITWTKTAFYSIYDKLVLKDKATVLFADLNDKHIACVISVYSSDTLHYFMNASSTNYLSYCPNDLLLHQTVIMAIEKNKKYVDLMTSRGDDIELIKFKDKWGTVHYPFYIFEDDLVFFRTKIWKWAWRFANSRWGAFLIRSFRR